MPYSPPVGTANLPLSGAWTPPVGTANLNLAPPGAARALAIAARTGGARAALWIGVPRRVTVAARTGGARGIAAIAYDPNLLSAVHAIAAEDWREAGPASPGVYESWSRSTLKVAGGPERWNESMRLPAGRFESWRQAGRRALDSGAARWRRADAGAGAHGAAWVQAPRRAQGVKTAFSGALALGDAARAPWVKTLPRIALSRVFRHAQGAPLPLLIVERAGQGERRQWGTIERWRQAGYPWNAGNPGPGIPPPIPPPWGTTLRLACPLPGTALRIGRVPCVLLAEREIPVRRTYMSINSASLVRLPDLAPLPVTAMTVETEFESWCWGFSATLAGPDAWALVQPNPLACEVLATINGAQWKFLLDVPSTTRAFNSDRVTLKGRSRSAWLDAPYTPARNLSEANPREMAQLAEQALANTGWSVDWQIPNWLVPAGRWNASDTPAGAVRRLARATGDGLYTDPSAQVLTVHPRWPLASWLLDGAVVDILVPEAAVLSLTQQPVYTLPLNGVYVSGTTHGALALVKIAGTDGALQPADPLVDALLCDPEGVAARQRGLNALSDAGPGWAMDAELLFSPEVGLIRPGLVVSIAGLKGVSRSCRIAAAWSGGGLTVRQRVGLERREVEA